MAKPRAFSEYPKGSKLPYGPFMSVVDRVIDADTIVVVADCGLDAYPCVVVRLARINAPEIGSPGGHEAKAFVADLMLPTMVEPAPVRFAPLQKDPYGRYVGEVFLADGTNLSDRIVGEGHAEYRNY